MSLGAFGIPIEIAQKHLQKRRLRWVEGKELKADLPGLTDLRRPNRTGVERQRFRFNIFVKDQAHLHSIGLPRLNRRFKLGAQAPFTQVYTATANLIAFVADSDGCVGGETWGTACGFLSVHSGTISWRAHMRKKAANVQTAAEPVAR